MRGGHSGLGCYGEHARYKAHFLNAFVKQNQVHSVFEPGCGDGNQLSLCAFEQYTGMDGAPTIIQYCRKTFAKDPGKAFYLPGDAPRPLTAQLAQSLDVLYYLVKPKVFDNYMHLLFRSATRFVIIYAWDVDGKQQ